ncbi:hypothetical protein [uncultured Kordia sp.]|uniref:hypothetical protein n=1 Tax=uncultured Kordia sp. TaxID=507699 RepID=UPI002634E48B|nr:hypothetical protein [uncultured Kordia sp.]
MSLQIQYSKTIAKELGKVAVYLPGEKIQVGDIVQFPHGKGIFKIAPFGSFKKITDLKSLDITCDITSDSESADSYQFTSKNVVEIDTNLGGTIDTTLKKTPKGSGKLQLSFSKKGSIFFHALECTKQSLNNIHNLESEINDNGKQLVWDDTYLVTAVTVAKKAMVVQSTSKDFQLELGGDIKNIKSGALGLDVAANINITKKKGSAFIKEWSDDVTVFVDVMRFKKKFFQKDGLFDNDSLLLDNDDSYKLKLESVDLKQYLK